MTNRFCRLSKTALRTVIFERHFPMNKKASLRHLQLIPLRLKALVPLPKKKISVLASR
jgi:hypothetical protein